MTHDENLVAAPNAKITRIPTFEKLKRHARNGRLVVFVGAGVSAVAPANLPTWWMLNRAVVEALSVECAGIVGAETAQRYAESIVARQETRQLPPEFQADIIASRWHRTYFDVLRCLDADTPNTVHRQIAALVKAGRVATIVTTNFDRLIERACAEIDAPLSVCVKPAEFAAHAEQLTHPHPHPQIKGNRRGVGGDGGQAEPCRLLKIHGCVSEPETLIDTLAQRKIGVPASIATCLKFWRRQAHWLILGYSGADLAADPNYLFLRAEAARANGLTWLVRHEHSVSGVVRDLIEHCCEHGDDAQLAIGELPRWLTPLVPRAHRRHTHVPAHSPSSAAATAERVRVHVANWAATQGAVACGVVLADLLGAAGQGPSGMELAETLYRHVATTSPRATPEVVMVCNMLGAMRTQCGDYAGAHAIVQQERAACETLGDEIGRARALTTLAHISEARTERRCQGDLPGALSANLGALAIFKRLGNIFDQGLVHNSLATMYLDLDNLDAADAHFRLAQQIKLDHGDECGLAITLAGLATVSRRRGDHATAFALLRDALRIRRRVGDRRGVGETLFLLGQYWLDDRKKRRQAALCLELALAILAPMRANLAPVVAATLARCRTPTIENE